MRHAMLVAMTITGCGSARVDAAPAERAPSIAVHPVGDGKLCVTKGAVDSQAIREPTVRAFGLGTTGDAAELTFTFRGDSDNVRELANGQARRQLGLKLRAQDSCNVVYVMWRLDPKPKLDISVKRNPGKQTHEQCGADGYTKVKGRATAVPTLEVGTSYTLRAEIVGDELSAWIDGKLVWHGRLPDEARAISGPAGLRSDNVKLDLISLSAPHSSAAEPACKRHDHDD